MINAFSLQTSEADIVENALEDIKGQMENLVLLKNTVGIIACHYDYIDGGILEAISEVLPFPLIGYTTFYQSTPKIGGLFEMTITVLTSDDVRFVTASCSQEADKEEAVSLIKDTYEEAFAVYAEKPSLMMSFLSMNRPISGDEFLRHLDECSGGVPVFGGVTAGDDDSGGNMFVICGKQVFTMGFVVLLIIGDVECSFYYGNFKEENLMMMTATVTESEGVTVKKLNERPATHFMEMNGIQLTPETKGALLTVPILFKQQDEDISVARTMVDFNEAGEALFFGEIPEGASLRIGTANSDDILEVAQQVTRTAAVNSGDASVWFMFSCVGRYVALGLEPTLELDSIKGLIPDKMTYLSGYVGGEMCPVYTENGWSNRYHNSSFIVCTLR